MKFNALAIIFSIVLLSCGGSNSNNSDDSPVNQASPTPVPQNTGSPTPTSEISPQITPTPLDNNTETPLAQPTETPNQTATPAPTPTPSELFPSLIELPEPQPLGFDADVDVSLNQSTYPINHWQFSLNSNNTLESVNYLVPDSTTLASWVMENEYLRVTLVPEFGGRIVSIFNKITNHEELYQNPMLSPYLSGTNIFYYDWLMIFGGIFPTFPEPEHGKTWLIPWETEIVHAGGDIATLRMSYRDDFDFAGAPFQYNYGVTNMICTFTVSLKAGRSAVDIIVTVENPTDSAKNYEYWTNTAPAPGSDPGDTALTDGYEIIADIASLAPPRNGFGSAYGIVNQGNQIWDEIKFFRNHNTDGIAYPNPNIANSNFWGAINHDNQEGFFRIADNTITPGLKIFTFGRDNTINADPMGPTTNNANWQRPAVELWAGASNQFFLNASMPARSFFNLDETYTPSVGMSNVTHANSDVLVNIEDDGIDLYFITPDLAYRVTVSDGGETVFQQTMTPDPLNGNRISHTFNSTGNLLITDLDSREILNINF